jgi:hypothetical protein
VSRTKSSRGLSGKSKSSRILSKVALKKDDKDHSNHKGTTSYRRGCPLAAWRVQPTHIPFGTSAENRKSQKRMSFDLGDDDLVAKLQNVRSYTHAHKHTQHTHTHTPLRALMIVYA